MSMTVYARRLPPYVREFTVLHCISKVVEIENYLTYNGQGLFGQSPSQVR